MRSNTRIALAALLSSSLPACGNVAAIPGVAPDSAPHALAQAICPKAYQCCMTEQLMSNDQAGTDVATCEAKTQAALENQVAAIKASEKKGRVVYDGTKVQACVDLLTSATTTCATLATTNHLSGLPACASFLQPKVPLGGACGEDFECQGGFCGRADGVAGDGMCRAFTPLDAACPAGARCASGLVCGATSKTCVAVPATTPPAANTCFYSSACNAGGADRGAGSLVTIALLGLAIAMRKRHRA